MYIQYVCTYMSVCVCISTHAHTCMHVHMGWLELRTLLLLYRLSVSCGGRQSTTVSLAVINSARRRKGDEGPSGLKTVPLRRGSWELESSPAGSHLIGQKDDGLLETRPDHQGAYKCLLTSSGVRVQRHRLVTAAAGTIPVMVGAAISLFFTGETR